VSEVPAPVNSQHSTFNSQITVAEFKY
jgi:hypothetical protein